MTTRKVYADFGDIKLLFAEEADRLLVYDMSTEPEIFNSMSVGDNFFPYDEIENEDPEFFNGQDSYNKYLFIEYNGELAGVISHTYNDAPIQNFELDIWLKTNSLTGKGIGSRSIRHLAEYLFKKYKIDTFIMRPYIKNTRAVKAYQKAGLKIVDNFEPNKYYTKYLEEYGEGDYGADTANMVMVLK